MAEWISLKDIADGAKFYARAAIKIVPTACGLAEGILSPKTGLFTLSRTMLRTRAILTASA